MLRSEKREVLDQEKGVCTEFGLGREKKRERKNRSCSFVRSLTVLNASTIA